MKSSHELAEAAQAAIGRQDWAAAEAALRRLCRRLESPPAGIAYNLGLVLRRAGKADEAVEWLRRALLADPAHANARYELAAQQMECGALEAALQGFQTYLEGSPADVDAWRNLGRILMQLGRWDEARDIWQGLAERLPEDLAAALQAARCRSELGEIDDAFDDYRTLGRQSAALRPAILKSLTHSGRGMIPLDPAALFGTPEDPPKR